MAYYGFEVETNLNNSAFTLDKFTSDGVTSIYTLSTPKPLTSRAILLSFDGVVQVSETDYTLDTNSNLEILNVPSNGVVITALHLTRPTHLYTIPDRSVTSTKLAGNLQTPGDLVVTGNITVNGTMSVLGQQEESQEVVTTLPTLSVEAALITINSDTTGAPSEDSGIKIERGTSADKTLIWDESVDKWSIGSETLIGNIEGNVTGTASGNVSKTGDTMTGSLTLSGSPSLDDHASTKAYVDRQAFLQALLF